MQYIGAIWFLLALFWGVLLTRFLLIDRPYAAITMLMVVCLGCCSAQYVFLPWSIQPGMMSVMFLYAGYLAKLNGFFDNPPHVLFVVACIAACVVSFVLQIRISMVAASFDCLAIISAFASSLIVIWTCKYILVRSHILSRFLGFVGRNTLVMLGIHLIDLNLFGFAREMLRDALPFSVTAESIVILCLRFFIYPFLTLIVVAVRKALRERKEISPNKKRDRSIDPRQGKDVTTVCR